MLYFQYVCIYFLGLYPIFSYMRFEKNASREKEIIEILTDLHQVFQRMYLAKARDNTLHNEILSPFFKLGWWICLDMLQDQFVAQLNPAGVASQLKKLTPIFICYDHSPTRTQEQVRVEFSTVEYIQTVGLSLKGFKHAIVMLKHKQCSENDNDVNKDSVEKANERTGTMSLIISVSRKFWLLNTLSLLMISISKIAIICVIKQLHILVEKQIMRWCFRYRWFCGGQKYCTTFQMLATSDRMNIVLRYDCVFFRGVSELHFGYTYFMQKKPCAEIYLKNLRW